MAFNNDVNSAPLPVSFEVFRVDEDLYKGEIKLVEPENPSDERMVFRHSGDFGGRILPRCLQSVGEPRYRRTAANCPHDICKGRIVECNIVRGCKAHERSERRSE